MKEILVAEDIQNMLLKLGQDITDSEQILTELDSVIGDGDLGMTLVIGFKEITTLLNSRKFDSISEILIESAEVFSEKAASTFGTLLTVMLKSAGKSSKTFSSIKTEEAAVIFEAAVAGVQKRGKAQLGDKTLLDALIPASDSLRKSSDSHLSLSEASSLALCEAEKGAENTIKMKARTGRSGYLGDRTIGQKDPGAAAVVIILKSFASYIS